jgi:hypothetical protein
MMNQDQSSATPWLTVQVPRCAIGDEGTDIRNIVARDLAFDVGRNDRRDTIAFGAELTSCEVRLLTYAKHAIVHNAQFTRCRFIARKTQVNLNWRNIVFNGCTFQGTFRYCSFGFGITVDRSHPAGLVNGDFAKARLDYCTLGNAKLDTLVYPAAPHMIFFEPLKNRAAINRIIPDQPIQTFLQMTSFHDGECSAVAYSMKYLERKKEIPATQLDELVRRCRQLDFVRVNF